MTEGELLALNVYQEAGGESDDGKAAVARIVKNRMAHKFFSDGTVYGTVLAKDQFSWAYFGFVTLHTGTTDPAKNTQGYVRIAHTMTEAQALAESLLKRTVPRVFNKCGSIAQAVMEGVYSSPAYDKLTDEAVSYLNPRILTRLPKWAIPAKLVCSIGHHDFYRA